MKAQKPLLGVRLSWILFGTLDKTIATISLAMGFVSLMFSIWPYFVSAPNQNFYYLRDILVVLVLVMMILLIGLKLLVVETKAENFHNLLDSQLETNHKMVGKFRDLFFKDIRIPLFEENGATDKALLSQNYSYSVYHSLLADTRELLKEYYRSRNYHLDDDLSLTVKLLVNHEVAQGILERSDGPHADILSPKGQYIISLFRDPYTWEANPMRREVKQIVYRVDRNTTFSEIITHKKPKYFSNNLRELYDKGEYVNQNEHWNNFYNSALAVPILYNPKNNIQDVIYYGILAVDSKNLRKQDLFSAQPPYNILSHTADLFAIMFGHVEIFQNFDITTFKENRERS